MKCIHCQNDALYKDRTNGKCPKCGHSFAFEPKSGDTLTDGAFKAAIDRVSSGGTVKWTRDHLYYEVARRMSKTGKSAIAFGILGLIVALLGFVSAGFLIPATVLLMVAAFRIPRRLARLTPQAFGLLWDKWHRAHGDPAALIVRRALPPAQPARPLPRDIEAYSFDRAVICDRPETVDLLLANNFHFENNCAVLSIGGYPPQVFETVRAMLKRNPKLSVYALHDATLEGCLLAPRLTRSPEWFARGARVIDVGLSPRQAGAFKGSFLPSVSFNPSPLLSDADNQWLSSYSLELAVIPPEQLIKRLFRAMSAAPQAPLRASAGDAGAGGILYIHDGTLSTEASASDGGGDSFG